MDRPNPMPPWNFRRSNGGEAKSVAGPGSFSQNSKTKSTSPPTNSTGQVIGNKQSKIYHLSNCPNYSDVSEQNLGLFQNAGRSRKSWLQKSTELSLNLFYDN
jgi:hypothetical protein